MLRSPGSSRPARPMIPEDIELKIRLLGMNAQWDHSSRSFILMVEGIRSPMGWAVTIEELAGDGWDVALARVADNIVKARIPTGYMSTSPVETFKVDAASVIDTENFK